MTKRKYHSVSRAARKIFKSRRGIYGSRAHSAPFIIIVVVLVAVVFVVVFVVVADVVTAHRSNNYTTRCDESYRGQCDTKTTRSPDMSPRKINDIKVKIYIDTRFASVP